MTATKELIVKSESINLGDSTLVSISKNSVRILCYNEATIDRQVRCTPSPIYSISDVINDIFFPYSSLNLTGYNSSIILGFNQEYNIPGNIVGTNISSKSLLVNGTGQWSLTNNTVVVEKIYTNAEENNLDMPVSGNTCFQYTAERINVTVSVNYNATTSLSINDEQGQQISDSTLQTQLTSISGDQHFNIVGNRADFFFNGSIIINTLITNFISTLYFQCGESTTTSEPLLSSKVSNSSIGKILGSLNITISTASYYHLKYYELVRRDDCFEMFTVILIVPLWVNSPGYSDEKRKAIRTLIGDSLLHKDIDKVSTYGKFKANTPNEIQYVINDLNGVKIFDSSGILLYENGDFCNKAFVYAADFNEYGCQRSSISWHPCGRFWNCGEYNYWEHGLKFRVSFDFYDNHDLSIGGIRVGDFDGDGVDDLWCHYPHTTRDYNAIYANQIIFSPLSNSTLPINSKTRDRCDTITDLQIPGWCHDGVIQVGDFNGDKRSDVLCISRDGNFYMLYGLYGTMQPATEHPRGLLPLNNITIGWNPWYQADTRWNPETFNDYYTLLYTIVVGDFNGDRHSDLLLLNRDDKSTPDNYIILLGSATSYFIKSNDYGILNSNDDIKKCKLATANTVFAEDINFDNVDEIICGDQVKLSILLSRRRSPASSTTNRKMSLQSSSDKNLNLVTAAQPKNYLNPLKQVEIIVNQINLKLNQNLDALDKKNILVHSSLDSKVFGKAKLSLNPSTDLKTVSKVYLPLENLKLNDVNAVVNFAFSGVYKIPGDIVSDKNNLEHEIEVPISVNVKWIIDEGKTIDVILESNKANMFFMSSFNTPVSCFYNNLINQYITVRLNFEATPQMYIETDGAIIVGEDLKAASEQIISETTLGNNGDYTSFPLDGYMDINILLGGHANMEHCD